MLRMRKICAACARSEKSEFTDRAQSRTSLRQHDVFLATLTRRLAKRWHWLRQRRPALGTLVCSNVQGLEKWRAGEDSNPRPLDS